MKTKFILGSLVLATTFVGCSNEELNVVANENQSNLIELSENFMIAGAGVEGAESRTHWVKEGNSLKNAFIPVVANAADANASFAGTNNVTAPSIGLCWLGQTPGEQVYTNYEFIHNGWLGKNQNAPMFDICSGIMTNGWIYGELSTTGSLPGVGEEVIAATTELNSSAVKKDANGNTLNVKELNLNSGIYKTENKSIFGGQYIAYFPYNPNFINAGTIPATSAVEFKDVVKGDNGLKSTDIADNTFRYTNVATIEGGAKADGFGFNNLSGVLRISLQGTATCDVEKILLYSPSSAFKKEVRLSASAIAAGKTGTELYAETVETSKTILVNMAASNSVKFVTADATAAVKDAQAVYITMLPGTISDLKVLAYDANDKRWAEYTVGSVTIPAGGSKQIVATMTNDDFKPVYYAADATTLATALAEATAVATENTPVTVKTLGDITINKYATIPAVTQYVTLEGDDIYVAEDGYFSVYGGKVKSNIFVEGKTCCGGATASGILVLKDATMEGKVTIEEGYQAANGRMSLLGTVNFTATSEIVSNGLIYNQEATPAQPFTLNVAGKFTNNYGFAVNEGSEFNSNGATLINNGQIEVLGKFNVLDATGATVAAAGELFTNNGTFIDNVGAIVGGATQYMINNGDYICKVHEQARLDEAYTNKLASNIIEFVNVATTNYDFAKAVKHNDKDVDLVINAVVGVKSTANATVGNVKVKADKALYINNTLMSGSTTVYTEININGNLDNEGTFVVEKDVRNLKAKNMTTYKDATSTFKNRTTYNGKTMVVSGTIEVKKGGTFTIQPKTAGSNIALVTCTKLVEGGTFNGKPEVVR